MRRRDAGIAKMSKQRVFRPECDASGCAPGHLSSPAVHRDTPSISYAIALPISLYHSYYAFQAHQYIDEEISFIKNYLTNTAILYLYSLFIIIDINKAIKALCFFFSFRLSSHY